MTAILPAYAPLIASKDRPVRKPLPAWKSNLIVSLQSVLARARPDPAQLAKLLNNLALVEAYRGNHDGALRVCHAQIAFWKAMAMHDGDDGCLGGAIQPWINLIRLERWQHKAERAMASYRELGPQQRATLGQFNRRCRVERTLGQLCSMTGPHDYSTLLDNVYWSEYPRLLLAAGRHDELQQVLMQGLNGRPSDFLRVTLIELLLVQQTERGKYGNVRALLAQIKAQFAKADHYRLQFTVLELYLTYRERNLVDPVLLGQVRAMALSPRHAAPDEHGLHLLLEIARVLHLLGACQTEADVLAAAAPLARSLDDEMAQFDVASRQQALGVAAQVALGVRFGRSSYGLIRTRLGLGRPDAACEASSARLLAAVECLARRDFDGCLERLDAGARQAHYAEQT